MVRLGILLFLVLGFTGTAWAKDWSEYPVLRVRIMDKVTAQSKLYDLNVNRTVAYGTLRIRPKTCRKTGPLDEPESATFLQIWEVEPTATATQEKPANEGKWLFSGWMFASSPSLSALDHPVYDVWLVGCIDPNAKPDDPVKETDTTPEASTDAPTSDADTNETPSTDNADDSLD